MCSVDCPCSASEMKPIYDNFNETYLNFYGRTNNVAADYEVGKISYIPMFYNSEGKVNETYFETFQNCWNIKLRPKF